MVLLSDLINTITRATSYLSDKSWKNFADTASDTVCACVVFVANAANIWSITWWVSFSHAFVSNTYPTSFF